MEKSETKPKTTKVVKSTAKKSDKYNPYPGFTVSAYLRRAGKFSWRGDTYRTYELTEKQLEKLAQDEKFPHIRKR